MGLGLLKLQLQDLKKRRVLNFMLWRLRPACAFAFGNGAYTGSILAPVFYARLTVEEPRPNPGSYDTFCLAPPPSSVS